jgi:hypothetical protein
MQTDELLTIAAIGFYFGILGTAAHLHVYKVIQCKLNEARSRKRIEEWVKANPESAKHLYESFMSFNKALRNSTYSLKDN